MRGRPQASDSSRRQTLPQGFSSFPAASGRLGTASEQGCRTVAGRRLCPRNPPHDVKAYIRCGMEAEHQLPVTF
jgi:hypothetical protein